MMREGMTVERRGDREGDGVEEELADFHNS